MNPETAPESQIDTGPDILGVNYESIDAKNFEKAKEMEVFYKEIGKEGGELEKSTKQILAKRFTQDLAKRENPNTGSPYTLEELNGFWLYHIVSGDTLGDSERSHFYEVMEYDLPEGDIQHFIESLPTAIPRAAEKFMSFIQNQEKNNLHLL